LLNGTKFSGDINTQFKIIYIMIKLMK